MITQAINLNLIPGQVLPRVNVSQYDSGTRTLRMTLFNGEQIFNVPSGASGYIQGTKPDRTGFQYAATVTAGSNIVTIDITQQMTAVKGEVVCELVLANGSDRIATVNFIIYVEPAALADDTVISETDLPLIEQAAELAQEIEVIADQVAADAQTASDAAQRAEEWASDSPYIGANGHWFVYDTTLGQFVDTNINATGPQGATGPTGPQGPQGDAATITVGTVTTLPAGSQATVTNSGTSEEAVFNFGIPKGQDGLGAGDMLKADYDANGAVELAGGIASYVSTAISGKANTADLGTAAYKDSTNAVTSGSTDLVESGAVASEFDTVNSSIQTLEDNDDAMLNVLGAKNLLQNNATSQTINGVTFTVNSDGSVTANGTATANAVFILVGSSSAFANVEYTNCTISGCPSGGGANSYWIVLQQSSDGSTVASTFVDSGEEAYTGSIRYPYSKVYIRIASGYACNNLVFKPMIRPTAVADKTYVPYAMTNRELTDASSVSLGYGIYLRKLGSMRIIDTSNSSASFPSAGISLGENVKYPAFGVCVFTKGSLQTGFLYVTTDNKLRLLTNVGAVTDGTYVNGQVVYFV